MTEDNKDNSSSVEYGSNKSTTRHFVEALQRLVTTPIRMAQYLSKEMKPAFAYLATAAYFGSIIGACVASTVIGTSVTEAVIVGTLGVGMSCVAFNEALDFENAEKDLLPSS